jgi:hypothetical protein
MAGDSHADLGLRISDRKKNPVIQFRISEWQEAL